MSIVDGNIFTNGEEFRVEWFRKILMDCRLIDNFIIEVFRNDSNMKYKRDTSEAWGIGILIVVCGIMFGMKKDLLIVKWLVEFGHY